MGRPMPVLNDTYDFARQAPASHQAAFTRRLGVHRILVRAGTELCKLTEHCLVFKGDMTPWWNYHRPSVIALPGGSAVSVPGFDEVQARAKGLGATDEQFG